MREILFRGKRLDNGEWVEGFYAYIESDNRHVIITQDTHTEFGGLWYTTVDPATVGQYTGMTDKNGKRIFEGDVVAFKRDNALGYITSRIGVVRYYDKLPIFYIMSITGDAWDWCECEEIEIVSNIYRNPELLKGE